MNLIKLDDLKAAYEKLGGVGKYFFPTAIAELLKNPGKYSSLESYKIIKANSWWFHKYAYSGFDTYFKRISLFDYYLTKMEKAGLLTGEMAELNFNTLMDVPQDSDNIYLKSYLHPGMATTYVDQMSRMILAVHKNHLLGAKDNTGKTAYELLAQSFSTVVNPTHAIEILDEAGILKETNGIDYLSFAVNSKYPEESAKLLEICFKYKLLTVDVFTQLKKIEDKQEFSSMVDLLRFMDKEGLLDKTNAFGYLDQFSHNIDKDYRRIENILYDLRKADMLHEKTNAVRYVDLIFNHKDAPRLASALRDLVDRSSNSEDILYAVASSDRGDDCANVIIQLSKTTLLSGPKRQDNLKAISQLERPYDINYILQRITSDAALLPLLTQDALDVLIKCERPYDLNSCMRYLTPSENKPNLLTPKNLKVLLEMEYNGNNALATLLEHMDKLGLINQGNLDKIISVVKNDVRNGYNCHLIYAAWDEIRAQESFDMFVQTWSNKPHRGNGRQVLEEAGPDVQTTIDPQKSRTKTTKSALEMKEELQRTTRKGTEDDSEQVSRNRLARD